METNLDKFGRLIIPKKLREHLGITPQTRLHIEEDGNRIVIEPIQKEEALVEKEGILVFTGKLEGNANQFISADREKRMKKLLLEDS